MLPTWSGSQLTETILPTSYVRIIILHHWTYMNEQIIWRVEAHPNSILQKVAELRPSQVCE